MPSGLADLLLREVGTPPWTNQQIDHFKPLYLVGRSDEEEAFDEFIGFR
jgi:hypothetical protein